MKKLVSIVLITALLICSVTVAYADTSNIETVENVNYKDLKATNWAYEAVNTMSQKGIVKGYTDGNFKPGNVVTYGEFIKMALVASTNEDIGNSKKGNWAKSYYEKALELGYFGSTDIKENQLSYQIPRSYMALIISNILGETKIDNYDELESDLKDVNSETKHDYDIIRSYATGIITGYQNSTFKPDKTLTRAESATVIYRLIDESKRVMPLEKKETETSKNMVDVLVGTKTYTFESHDVQLGYNGVEKIEIHSSGDILIYSTVCYDTIRVSIDNCFVDSICFTNGFDYFKKDGYYVYDADPTTFTKNINVKGKTPSLYFVGDDENIYRYTDVTL